MTESIALTTKSDEGIEQVELFSIDGKSYTIANKPRLNVALKTLKLMRKEGEEVAMAYMMEAAIGEEAFDALTEYEDLDADTFGAIVSAAQKIVFGGLEAPKGN
jgi:hypothetical protein